MIASLCAFNIQKDDCVCFWYANVMDTILLYIVIHAHLIYL